MECARFEQLAFFGRMGRHVSHELKNVMATISETAGLLLDLMEFHGSDKGPGGPRLKELGERIVHLVERGNVTVHAFNIFSHSVDDPQAQVEICDLAELVVEMAGYFPYARKVNLVKGTCEGVALYTKPYLIMNLTHEYLTSVFPRMEMGQEVSMDLACADGDVVMSLESPLALDAAEPWMQTIGILARDLGGGMVLDPGRTRLTVTIPDLAKD